MAAAIAGLITLATARPSIRAALHHGTVALAFLLFLLSLVRFGKRGERLAYRLENTEQANGVQTMPDVAGRRLSRSQRAC